MAKIDFPAIVDFVLKETNQSKIYVTGNSMGCTIPFTFLSSNHSYDDNVSLTGIFRREKQPFSWQNV